MPCAGKLSSSPHAQLHERVVPERNRPLSLVRATLSRRKVGLEMRRKICVCASVFAGVIGLTAGTAAASHPHHIDTPGSCVDRNGSGFGTGQEHSDNTADPGDTTFHERFHKGTPGTFAFTQGNNPVSVSGGVCQ